MSSISLKTHRFLIANETHAVIYCGVDDHLCTFRLEDGSSWVFTRREASKIGHPVWAYMKVPDQRIISHRLEEMKLLERLEREARLPSDLS